MTPDGSTARPPAAAGGAPGSPPVERLSALSALVGSLLSPESAAEDPAGEGRVNQLAAVRLGVASSLFLALQAKHPPTAQHSLRVAVGCSAWGLRLRLPNPDLDALEVAALLHDIGKIGVPDHVLLKPGALNGDELRRVRSARQTARAILGACCASDNVLEMVHYAAAWYDGARFGFDRSRRDLPLGARMIAVVDAFDSMTTAHAYRPAKPHERALAELCEQAGTQFDPELVEDFCRWMTERPSRLADQTASRWLRELPAEDPNRMWARRTPDLEDHMSLEGMFHQRLLDNLLDGVVFLDAELQILLWNPAAERLTGLPAATVLHRRWTPSLVELRDERSKLVADEQCPVAQAIRSRVRIVRRMTIRGRRLDRQPVDIHIAPVLGPDGLARGAMVLLHDSTSKVRLEERVQTLQQRAVSDPLTGLANRAEFDTALASLAGRGAGGQAAPCSLIICDVDHFKQVNDVHGHQAGDAVLVSFASLLEQSARMGDVVARYGGEEFVLLCPDCPGAAAVQRAEAIRARLADTPQPTLSGRPITASFGVTELQPGDTPETMLRRADRALLEAKRLGRNRVVQLGVGPGDASEAAPPRRSWLFGWLRAAPPGQLVARTLICPTPLDVTTEKLRGFIIDHRAQVEQRDRQRLALTVMGSPELLRRSSDRPSPLVMELELEAVGPDADAAWKSRGGTAVHVTVRPKRRRERRREAATARAVRLLESLKAYLMARDALDAGDPAGA